jgi:hypothetical protein
LKSRCEILENDQKVLIQQFEDHKKVVEYELEDTWRFRARTRENFRALHFGGKELINYEEIKERKTTY